MPRFRFKLQRVLEVRRHKEDLLKNELASLKREYEHEASLLSELISKRLEKLNEMRKRQLERTIPVEEISWHYIYLTRMNTQIEEQKTKLKLLSDKIAQTKQKLIVASQEKRVIEKLKERRFEEYKREEERAEGAFLDEIALSMYTRGANQLSYKR
jgi:flagellar FliJ protein